MKSFIILIFLILVPLYGIAQLNAISGIITNQDNQPLMDVKIFCNNDSVIGYTDMNGRFSVMIPSGIETIYFFKTGYIKNSSSVVSGAEINLKLELESVYELSLEDLIMANVVTVSLKEQNISYAPGIITILTQKDFKRLGIRTLKEALSMIPGFSLMQNDDEQIFSVRGIFATTNQKLLIMRDGYPLNESNLDIPQTEYSISIENIKKIEIIRGPGASIYGNSAFASVINIITQDAENTLVKTSLGNYGQFDIDTYSSTELKNNGSILIYGRFSSNKGESFPVTIQPGKTLISGTYRTNHYPNNHDFGFKYKIKDFILSGASQHHEYQTYWTSQGYYTNVDSLFYQPGLMSENAYLNLKYEPEISENLNFHFTHYWGKGKLVNYRLLSAIDSVKYLSGRMQANEWNTAKFGANYYGLWNFSKKGQMLTGISYEIRSYLDSWLASNTIDSSKMVFSSQPFFPKGRETRGAIYLQTQYQLFRWLVFDIGGRYDIAQKFKSSFNPRAALIISPEEKLNFKIIYTEAFQAPGYSYRTSNADYSGSISNLEPEKLKTFQSSLRYNFDSKSYFEATGYYNKLKNLITRTQGNYYINFGKLASYGLELDYRQSVEPFYLFANYSLLLPDTNNMDPGFIIKNTYKNEFRHFPKHSANLGINYSYNNLFTISLNANYASGFKSLPGYEVKSRVILNSGIELDAIKKISILFRVYNFMNKQYKLGDPSVIPIEQPGRWFLFSVLYSMK